VDRQDELEIGSWVDYACEGFVVFVVSPCVFSPADLGDFFFADKLATALGTEPVYVNMYRYRLQNKPFNRL